MGQRSHISKPVLTWGGGIVVGLMSLFLISRSIATPFSRYQAYRDNILTLRALEANFSQEILKSRYELFAAYDTLVKNLNDQDALHAQLSAIPGFVSDTDAQELQRILQERGTALTQKADLSEWFKSRNALLKNSLRYLPFLTQQLETSFQGQAAGDLPEDASNISNDIEEPDADAAEEGATAVSADDATEPAAAETTAPPTAAAPPSSNLSAAQIATLQGTLNQLIRSLLLYNASGEATSADRAEALVQELSELENTLEIPEEVLPTQVFRSHANVILTTKPLVEELTGQLLLPLGQHTDDLEATLERAYQQAVRRVSLYRGISLIWFLGLLALANYRFIKRFRQRDPAFGRYQQQVATLATAAEQLQTRDSQRLVPRDHRPAETASLTPLLNRQDALGKLAQSVHQLALDQAQYQQATHEESFAFLTTRLSFLTKNRRKLITADSAEALRTALTDTLVQQGCELLELEFETDQVLVLFRYTPFLALAQLVHLLKAESAAVLYPLVADLDDTLLSPEDLWSDAYLIVSCDSPTRDASVRLAQGEPA